MDVNLELARTRLTVEHFAENLPLEEAERFYRFLNEKVAYLSRRIAREKLAIAKTKRLSVSYTAEDATSCPNGVCGVVGQKA